MKAHDLDELRFDISVNDCVWYLRTNSLEERARWMQAIEACRARFLKRAGSAHSVTSDVLQTQQQQQQTGATGGTQTKGRGLHEKLAEMETFR